MAAPDEYKALSPLGTAPVITEGGLALAESSAIMEYILDRIPNQSLRPQAIRLIGPAICSGGM